MLFIIFNSILIIEISLKESRYGKDGWDRL